MAPDVDGLPLGLESMVSAELQRASFREGCQRYEPMLQRLFERFSVPEQR